MQTELKLDKATYRNPWHSSRSLDPEFYTTEAKPREYRGYLIYNRIKAAPGRSGSGCWDVVKDGVCITQRAGDTNDGLNEIIDQIIADGVNSNQSGR